MECAAVIPARYGSTRLPGKPLRDLCGKPLIQRVYERVSQAKVFSEVLVATDSIEIYRCVEGFGGRAVMTDPGHRSGTDRVAEVARALDASVVVNVQGDEPFVRPEMLESLCRSFRSEERAVVGTLRCPVRDERELADPNVVKVVIDEAGYALYFSRSPIPHRRAEGTASVDGEQGVCYKHVGLYAYRRDFLLRFPYLPVTSLEKTENLEQLRVLGHGFEIRVYTTEWETWGIDTEEDLERARRLWANGKEFPLVR